MMLSHTHGVIPPNLPLWGSYLKHVLKEINSSPWQYFPYLQPIGGPYDYLMAEYDSGKCNCKMILLHFKWNFRMLPSCIPGKPHQTLTCSVIDYSRSSQEVTVRTHKTTAIDHMLLKPNRDSGLSTFSNLPHFCPYKPLCYFLNNFSIPRNKCLFQMP